jgi:hypothetical protein
MENSTNKTTLVVGASNNPARYSYKAITRLLENNIPVYAYSIKKGELNGVKFYNNWQDLKNKSIHTVSLYVGPKNQSAIIDEILELKPKRIIFNPGTENPEFINKAKDTGIDVVIGCTLVMLSVGNF